MALNKFMHPRNLYRTPPDFSKLATLYEDFASVAKKDVAGKVTIDFKDPKALRMLTKYLLKSDFDLDVTIPEDRLVPTLPLRLNYILWVEDLLNSINRNDNINGLDIGTGACAIYPLLAAVKNKWHMIGTESDDQSFIQAEENVNRNDLQDLIELKKTQCSSVLENVLSCENGPSIDFSMCNPPFYSNFQELYESRSPARLPPKNGFTGSPQELITEGGELVFCRKMIEESKLFPTKVLIFTTMVGHKFNLRELAQDLKADGITHTTTEFCQGRVTRWGLAWTFQDYDLSKLVPGRDKPRKKTLPVAYIIPDIPGMPYDFENVTNKLKSLLDAINVPYKILNKRGNFISFDIMAQSNTWSNQRRKRRQNKNSECDNEVKKVKIQSCEGTGDTPTTSSCFKQNSTVNEESKNINSSDLGNELIELQTIEKELEVNTKNNVSSANTSVKMEPLIHAFFKLFKKEAAFQIDMEYLDGSAGKEGLHQIIQYIKNNWK